jgi:hypothetical protein
VQQESNHKQQHSHSHTDRVPPSDTDDQHELQHSNHAHTPTHK